MIKRMILIGMCISLLSGCSLNHLKKDAQQEKANVSGFTARETIAQFFDRQYEAYTSLQSQEFDDLLDMSKLRNRNEEVWIKTLIQRRKLIAQQDLCYVCTEHSPYKITFDQHARDERMQVWNQTNVTKRNDTTIHFTITGEKGTIYPPFFAVNAQHTMQLKQSNGTWVITDHFFPGSERKFGFETALQVPSEQTMLVHLKQEFELPTKQTSTSDTNLSCAAVLYQGTLAAEYAQSHVESANPDFYQISDWMGNCSNFTSQCIWYGFYGGLQPEQPQDLMTSAWFAGSGGGTPAWENVEHFWNYATQEKTTGIFGEVVQSIFELNPGGLLQIQTKSSASSTEGYHHSLLLVDPTTLAFAQNSPNCFVYYSDLVCTNMRFFNPVYQILES